jgi:hypothetical protein
MHIPLLTGADNQQITSILEDGLGLRFRYDVRCSILFFGKLLLTFFHFAGKMDDHVVFIGFSIDRDASEFGSLDRHSFSGSGASGKSAAYLA